MVDNIFVGTQSIPSQKSALRPISAYGNSTQNRTTSAAASAFANITAAASTLANSTASGNTLNTQKRKIKFMSSDSTTGTYIPIIESNQSTSENLPSSSEESDHKKSKPSDDNEPVSDESESNSTPSTKSHKSNEEISSKSSNKTKSQALSSNCEESEFNNAIEPFIKCDDELNFNKVNPIVINYEPEEAKEIRLKKLRAAIMTVVFTTVAIVAVMVVLVSIIVTHGVMLTFIPCLASMSTTVNVVLIAGALISGPLGIYTSKLLEEYARQEKIGRRSEKPYHRHHLTFAKKCLENLKSNPSISLQETIENLNTSENRHVSLRDVLFALSKGGLKVGQKGMKEDEIPNQKGMKVDEIAEAVHLKKEEVSKILVQSYYCAEFSLNEIREKLGISEVEILFTLWNTSSSDLPLPLISIESLAKRFDLDKETVSKMLVKPCFNFYPILSLKQTSKDLRISPNQILSILSEGGRIEDKALAERFNLKDTDISLIRHFHKNKTICLERTSEDLSMEKEETLFTLWNTFGISIYDIKNKFNINYETVSKMLVKPYFNFHPILSLKQTSKDLRISPNQILSILSKGGIEDKALAKRFNLKDTEILLIRHFYKNKTISLERTSEKFSMPQEEILFILSNTFCISAEDIANRFKLNSEKVSKCLVNLYFNFYQSLSLKKTSEELSISPYQILSILLQNGFKPEDLAKKFGLKNIETLSILFFHHGNDINKTIRSTYMQQKDILFTLSNTFCISAEDIANKFKINTQEVYKNLATQYFYSKISLEETSQVLNISKEVILFILSDSSRISVDDLAKGFNFDKQKVLEDLVKSYFIYSSLSLKETSKELSTSPNEILSILLQNGVNYEDLTEKFGLEKNEILLSQDFHKNKTISLEETSKKFSIPQKEILVILWEKLDISVDALANKFQLNTLEVSKYLVNPYFNFYHSLSLKKTSEDLRISPNEILSILLQNEVTDEELAKKFGLKKNEILLSQDFHKNKTISLEETSKKFSIPEEEILFILWKKLDISIDALANKFQLNTLEVSKYLVNPYFNFYHSLSLKKTSEDLRISPNEILSILLQNKVTDEELAKKFGLKKVIILLSQDFHKNETISLKETSEKFSISEEEILFILWKKLDISVDDLANKFQLKKPEVAQTLFQYCFRWFHKLTNEEIIEMIGEELRAIIKELSE